MTYRNPAATVDIIIELIDRRDRPIVLIERQNEPLGWAIPGGLLTTANLLKERRSVKLRRNRLTGSVNRTIPGLF
jgi:ADP-ribose pyrophosphatase YjhB (NUDIX family)